MFLDCIDGEIEDKLSFDSALFRISKYLADSFSVFELKDNSREFLQMNFLLSG